MLDFSFWKILSTDVEISATPKFVLGSFSEKPKKAVTITVFSTFLKTIFTK